MCTCTGSTNACTEVTTAAGMTYTVKTSFTYTSTGWSGTQDTTVTTDDGGTVYTCDQMVSATLGD